MKRIIPFVLTSLFAMQGCMRQRVKDKKDKTPIVEVVQVEKVELFDNLEFAGTISPIEEKTLYAEVGGVVKKVHVKAGEAVQKGKTLLTLIPDADGLDMREHVLKAPRSGIILGDMPGKTGAHVNKTDPLLTVGDLSAFKIKLAATSKDLPYLKVRDSVEIRSFNEEKVFHGNLTFVAKVPDSKTKTFKVTVEVPCKEEDSCTGLYPGLLATVSVKQNPHWGYKVPYKYLRKQKSHLLILKADNTVTYIPVVLGKHYGEDVEIIEGLKAEMEIVSAYSTSPEEGQKVEVLRKEEKDSGNETQNISSKDQAKQSS